jgi:hypothetical protein
LDARARKPYGRLPAARGRAPAAAPPPGHAGLRLKGRVGVRVMRCAARRGVAVRVAAARFASYTGNCGFGVPVSTGEERGSFVGLRASHLGVDPSAARLQRAERHGLRQRRRANCNRVLRAPPSHPQPPPATQRMNRRRAQRCPLLAAVVRGGTYTPAREFRKPTHHGTCALASSGKRGTGARR